MGTVAHSFSRAIQISLTYTFIVLCIIQFPTRYNLQTPPLLYFFTLFSFFFLQHHFYLNPLHITFSTWNICLANEISTWDCPSYSFILFFFLLIFIIFYSSGGCVCMCGGREGMSPEVSTRHLSEQVPSEFWNSNRVWWR